MIWWLATWLATGAALAGNGGYTVGAGDTIRVEVYDEPDLTAEVVVGENCGVTLGLVGRVEVCDLTPSEIEARLTELYDGDFLVNPHVAVKVTEYRSRRVDVLGEVKTRGPLYLQGRTTLVEVISMAGGPTAENVVEVEVVGADGTRTSYDIAQLTSAASSVTVSAGDKVILKPGKVVYLEGEVVRPGTVTISEGLTVTEALARAGGADEYANLRKVVVRRADGSQIKVNVHRIHKGREEDIVLAADDHVLVPRGAF